MHPDGADTRALLLRYANDISMLFDADFRIVDCNERALEVYGYTREEMLGKSIGDLRSGDQRISLEDRMAGIRRRGDQVFESINVRKDGSTFPVETSVRVVETDDGLYYHTSVRDISERKADQEKIRESEKRYRGLFVNMLEGFAHCRMILDEEGRPDDFEYLLVNAAFARLTGLEDVVGKRVTEVIPTIKELTPELLETYGAVAATGEPAEFDIDFAPLGRWLHVSATRPAPGEFVAFFYDVTARKRAEAALGESDQRFRMALRNAPVSVAVQDQDLRYVWAYNQRTAQPDRIIGKVDAEVFTAAEAEHLGAIKHRVLSEGTEFHEEMWLDRPGGRMYLGVNFEPIRDPSGQVVGVGSATVDLTPLKLVEEALRDSRAKLEAALASMTDAVFISDAEGNFVDFNEAFATFHRFGSKAECSTTFAEYPDILDVFLDTGEPAPLDRWAVPRALNGEIVADAEYTLRRKDTGETWVGSYSFAPIRDGAEIVGSVVVARDVTERKAIEQTLRRSEAEARDAVSRLSRAQQLGHMGDWDWDPATGDVTWSEEVHRIFGVGPGFPVGFDTVVAMLHPEDRDGNMSRTQAIIDDPQRASGVLTFRIVRPDGAVRHIYQTVEIERDADGRAVRLYGIMQDVTELSEAEQAVRDSERRLRRFYEAGLVGVLFWTMDGEIVDANDRFLEIVGYSRDELNTQAIDWVRMTPPEQRYLDERSMEELRATGANAVPFEKEYIRKDGTRVPILIAGAMLDDELFNGVAFVLDITAQKLAERELRVLNLELEQRVEERTAELEAANSELEAFSYSVSHDLRSPLRHISGFSKLLAEHLGDDMDRETEHFLGTITRSVEEMGQLIDDLLQFSRTGRAELRMHGVDMRELVDEAMLQFGHELQDRRIEVRIGDLPSAQADRALLRQVWDNLLSNALKYTRGREPAIVEVGGSDGDGETVYYVRDNGVGFDMQYADRLFQVFHRLHRSEDFEGTGVGLANVRRIIARHGGRCWAEAKVDQGATFFFSLPERGESE